MSGEDNEVLIITGTILTWAAAAIWGLIFTRTGNRSGYH